MLLLLLPPLLLLLLPQEHVELERLRLRSRASPRHDRAEWWATDPQRLRQLAQSERDHDHHIPMPDAMAKCGARRTHAMESALHEQRARLERKHPEAALVKIFDRLATTPTKSPRRVPEAERSPSHRQKRSPQAQRSGARRQAATASRLSTPRHSSDSPLQQRLHSRARGRSSSSAVAGAQKPASPTMPAESVSSHTASEISFDLGDGTKAESESSHSGSELDFDLGPVPTLSQPEPALEAQPKPQPQPQAKPEPKPDTQPQSLPAHEAPAPLSEPGPEREREPELHPASELNSLMSGQPEPKPEPDDEVEKELELQLELEPELQPTLAPALNSLMSGQPEPKPEPNDEVEKELELQPELEPELQPTLAPAPAPEPSAESEPEPMLMPEPETECEPTPESIITLPDGAVEVKIAREGHSFGFSFSDSLVVTKMVPGGPAMQVGVSVGAQIVSAAGQRVDNKEALVAVLKQASFVILGLIPPSELQVIESKLSEKKEATSATPNTTSVKPVVDEEELPSMQEGRNMKDDEPVVRAKVHRIFVTLDEDRDGALKYTELQQLAVLTGGSLSQSDYRTVCEALNISPDIGVCEQGLLQCYTRLGLGDIDDDFAKMGLALKSESEPGRKRSNRIPRLAKGIRGDDESVDLEKTAAAVFWGGAAADDAAPCDTKKKRTRRLSMSMRRGSVSRQDPLMEIAALEAEDEEHARQEVAALQRKIREKGAAAVSDELSADSANERSKDTPASHPTSELLEFASHDTKKKRTRRLSMSMRRGSVSRQDPLTEMAALEAEEEEHARQEVAALQRKIREKGAAAVGDELSAGSAKEPSETIDMDLASSGAGMGSVMTKRKRRLSVSLRRGSLTPIVPEATAEMTETDLEEERRAREEVAALQQRIVEDGVRSVAKEFAQRAETEAEQYQETEADQHQVATSVPVDAAGHNHPLAEEGIPPLNPQQMAKTGPPVTDATTTGQDAAEEDVLALVTEDVASSVTAQGDTTCHVPEDASFNDLAADLA
eukprot:SAG25_NODE_953_length_4593_cov_6.284824_1_plen_1010_part_10